MNQPITIAGCRVAERDPEQLLSEAYALLTVLSVHIADQKDRAKVADEVMAGAIDAAATLVGLAYAGTIN